VTMQRLDSEYSNWTLPRLLALPPEALEIQPTAACHRMCTFCSHIVRNKLSGLLTEQRVLTLLDAAESLGVRQISLSGGGEPLYWEGPIDLVLARAHRFAYVTLTTSGDQFLDRPSGRLSSLAERCLPHVDAVLLNVPGVDEAGLRAQIVDGPTWAQVERLLCLLVERARTQGFLVLCAVVVNRANIDDVPRIDRVLHEIGVDRIYFKEFKLFGRDAARRPKARIDLRPLVGEEWTRGSADLRRFAASLRHERAAAGVPCWTNRVGAGAIIDPKGNVYLCTPTVGAESLAIGNVNNDGLLELWHGAERRRLVEELSDRARTGGCPIECRYHPHNRAFHQQRVGAGDGWVSNAGLDDFGSVSVST
jgi:radical SAM protein with 4Fe4S-binding SPASM domain